MLIPQGDRTSPALLMHGLHMAHPEEDGRAGERADSRQSWQTDSSQVIESAPTVTGHVDRMGLWSDVMKILSLWTSTKKYTTPIWPWGKRQIPVEGQLENTWLVPLTTPKVSEDRGSLRNCSGPEEPPETWPRGILDGILGQKKVYGNFNAVWTSVNDSVSTLAH